MKIATPLLTTFFFLGATLTASAQVSIAQEETPETQLQFIRKLRSKGYTDLAMEYLRELEKNPPAKIANELFLENARTLVYHSKKQDPEARVGMLNQARESLEAYLKKSATGPEAVKIRMELARLAADQGQAVLSKALREESTEDQQKEAFKAEELFIQAGKQIGEAFKLLPEEDKKEADFELAINLIDQSRTYIDTARREDLNRKKAVLIAQARKLLEKIAEEDKSVYANKATAWLVKCCQEMQDPDAASKYYKKSINAIGPGADEAARWGRYFRMESKRNDLKYIKVETEAWFKDYPTYYRSPEGYGVRWEKALGLFMEARQEKDQKAKETQKMYDAVQKLLSTFNEPDNDFSEKANQLNVSISVMRIGDKVEVADLKDFDDCYLRAQVELGRARDADEKGKGTEAEKKKARQDAINTAVQALKRGIMIADARVPAAKLDDARYLLMSIWFMTGDLPRAAVAAESLAKANPLNKRSAAGAGYAIEAYAAVYGREPIEDHKTRLQDMLDFVLSPEGQKKFGTDKSTGVARYQYAMMLDKDGNYKGAIEQLEKLPSDFSGLTYALSKGVFIATEARGKVDDPKEKKWYQDAARRAIAKLMLPKDIDNTSAEMYFHAQAEEVKFLYAEAAELMKENVPTRAAGKYAQMAKLIETLQTQLEASKLPPEKRDNMDYFLGVLRKYSTIGQGDVAYRQGEYDKVLAPELTGKVVADVKKRVAAEKVAKFKDYQVTGEIVGLALRANVQKGNMDEAKTLLKLLENVKPENASDLDGGSTNVLRNLVVELAAQVKQLKDSKDTKKLKQTIANFSDFLDALIAQKAGGAKGAKIEVIDLDRSEILFLANCYDSLDQHDKAAALYARYPRPRFVDDLKIQKFTPEQEKDLQTYWLIQIKHASQLRQAGKIDEAIILTDKLLEHKNGRLQLPAQKEKMHCMEDKAFWGAAIKGWGEILKNPALTSNLAKVPELKELYFDAYYHHAYCWFKYSQKSDLSAEKKAQFLNQAANYIVRLETSMNQEGWKMVGPRFTALLEAEPALNDTYKKLRAAQPAAGGQ